MMFRKYIRLTGLVLVSLIMFASVSCKRSAERAAEKMVERTIKKYGGEDVDIDLKNQKTVIQTEDGRMEIDAAASSWPSGIPSDVPQFSYGKISGVTTHETNEGKGWIIMMKDVPGNAPENYNNALKEKGFKTQFISVAETGGNITAEKDEIIVVAIISKGEANVSVQIARN